MSKTIEGVPEFITEEQYLSLFKACGFDPKDLVEMRMAHDGVHALVMETWPDGSRRLDPQADPPGYYKHRVFIPVRREDGDRRRTRIRQVTN